MPRTRQIEPVELLSGEAGIVKDIQIKAKQATGRRMSRGAILRRALRIAGPMLLNGERPLMEEVVLKPGK